jgi:hypothetical protein
VSDEDIRFSDVAAGMIVTHTVTYFAMGVLAFLLLDYASLYAQPDLAGFMRPTTDRLVMAGPLFQPIRGLVFALVLFPVRGVVFGQPRGWLVLWGLLAGLGIVSTFGPSPGSIEGLVYTQVSPAHQFLGLSEVLAQSLLLALGVTFWVDHPERRRMRRIAYVLLAVVLVLPLAGLIFGPQGG